MHHHGLSSSCHSVPLRPTPRSCGWSVIQLSSLAKHRTGALLQATLAFTSQSANKQLSALSPWRWRYGFRCRHIFYFVLWLDRPACMWHKLESLLFSLYSTCSCMCMHVIIRCVLNMHIYIGQRCTTHMCLHNHGSLDVTVWLLTAYMYVYATCKGNW